MLTNYLKAFKDVLIIMNIEIIITGILSLP